jgi:hypothetical protein
LEFEIFPEFWVLDFEVSDPQALTSIPTLAEGQFQASSKSPPPWHGQILDDF